MNLILGDCLEVMGKIPDGSVDMVLCDLPYGTTQNNWDSVIPFEPLWQEYWRICKSNAAVVLTAAQPFTSALIMSQIEAFKYEWIWCKKRKTGQLNAKQRPLISHETVIVFYRNQPFYNAYKEEKNPFAGTKATPTKTKNYGFIKEQENYKRPENLTKDSLLLGFDVGKERGLHPTQKPVALMEYLIKTYTNPGDLVLDNCMGSGTTGVACSNLGRRFIGIEKNREFFEIASNRINGRLI